MNNSLDNVLTPIDVTGPNFDITSLILNKPQEKRVTEDSEYRDSLARSLKESSRRHLKTKSRPGPSSEPVRSNRPTTRTFEKQSANTGLNRKDISKSTGDPSSLNKQPLQKGHSDSATQSPNADSESPENVTLTEAGAIPTGEESDVLESEQLLKIRAEIGLPPAQFQPFIITTTLENDVTTEIEPEEISNSLSGGRAHAQSVIENLINRIEISPNQEQLQNSGKLTPPAGLFQALNALDQHENTSENPNGNEFILSDELTIDLDAQIDSLVDSVEFEVTSSDADSEINSIVSTEQFKSDTIVQVEVSGNLALEAGLIENAPTEIQPQKTARGNSEGDDSGVGDPQLELNTQAAVLGGRTQQTMENTAMAADQSNESRQSVSNGPSQIQTQNSSDLSVEEIQAKDHSVKIKASSKQTVTRTEVNPQKLVNRVASAIRSAGQNGRVLRIRLQPPELGTLEIEVSSRNGVLSARLEVQTASARQSILENMSLLRDALSQNGTRLENIDVHLNERLHEGGQADLSKEQQQQDEQQTEQQDQQDDSDQSADENESESRQQAVGIATQIDQLDIQI